MFELEAIVNKIIKDGVPVKVELDPVSASYFSLAMFLAFFGALVLWSLVQKSFA